MTVSPTSLRRVSVRAAASPEPGLSTRPAGLAIDYVGL